MVRIYLQKLNPKLKRNILERRYTVSELEQVRKKVEQQIKTTQTGFRRAAVILFAVAAVVLCMTAAQIGAGTMFWFCTACVALIGIAALTAAWAAGFGIMKYQFNRAVKKAYPEHPDHLI